MERDPRPALPSIEALMRVLQMPRNGYVIARFAKRITDRSGEQRKVLWQKNVLCWHHFVCFVFRSQLPNSGGNPTLEKHWKGDTSAVALSECLQRMLDRELVRVVGTTDYDGRYRSECYYCNGSHGRVRGRDIQGPKRYVNSKEHGRGAA